MISLVMWPINEADLVPLGSARGHCSIVITNAADLIADFGIERVFLDWLNRVRSRPSIGDLSHHAFTRSAQDFISSWKVRKLSAL